MVARTGSYELTGAGPVPVLRWPALDAAGVHAVVTTRHGGVSQGPYESLNLSLHVGDTSAAVLENRARAAATLDLELDDLVFCNQSHQRNVVRIGAADRGRGSRSVEDAISGTDALVTTDPTVGLVVMVADCVPIVLVDPVARVLSCVHAGWRGTTSGVTEATIDMMVRLGAEPGRLVVGIGPARGPDSYQVGDDVRARATAHFGDDAVSRLVRPDGTGRWLFDLWAANIHLLRTRGVTVDNIHLADIGTGTDFFSDRSARPCGRFAAIARLRP